MTQPQQETLPQKLLQTKPGIAQAAPPGLPAPAPLLAALAVRDSYAAAAWESWRGSIQIQHLSWPDMQILPLLNGPRLEEWLAPDPAAGVLKGIVRRAWSEAQVRLGLARETALALDEAGCGPVTMTGAIGGYLRSLESSAIRPVLELRMLIPRRHLALAAATLQGLGWQPRDVLPTGDWLNRMSHMLYNRNGTRLYLHWRALEVDPRRAAACEHEFLRDHRIVEAIGTRFRILAPEHALLEALADAPDTVDALAWEAGAALIFRALKPGEAIDWRRWSIAAARFQPRVFERIEAFEKISALHAMGLDIPAIDPPSGLALLPLSELAQAAVQTARRTVCAWLGRFSTTAEKA